MAHSLCTLSSPLYSAPCLAISSASMRHRISPFRSRIVSLGTILQVCFQRSSGITDNFPAIRTSSHIFITPKKKILEPFAPIWVFIWLFKVAWVTDLPHKHWMKRVPIIPRVELLQELCTAWTLSHCPPAFTLLEHAFVVWLQGFHPEKNFRKRKRS